MKVKKVLLLTFFLNLIYIQAQEKTYSSGGSATGSGGNINYSVGQIVSNDNSDGTFTISRGIQQAYEISNILNLNIPQSTDIEISIFPNPTADYINLSLNISNSNKLVYQLYDSIGRLILTKNNLKTNETISMEEFPSTVYYLNILENNLIIKTYKIIKN